MRKFLTLIIFFNLLIVNISFAKEIEYLLFKSSNYEKPKNFDAFVWHEGKKLKIIKGRDIDNPKDKIIVIYNHGGWGWNKGWGPGWDLYLAKLMAPQLSGKKINGKEIVLWMNGSLIDKKNDPYKGKEIGYACGWKLKGAWHQEWHECVLNDFPTYLREKRTIEIINYFADKGTPRDQIFLSGHSCGGWNALRLKGKYPDAFNAAISYMPNCWDRRPNGLVRKTLIDEMKTFKKLDAIIYSSPVDGGEDWKASYQDLKWIGDIPGTKMIKLPGHNAKDGKEISVNGNLCENMPRMHGGWEEVWPEGKKKLRSAKKFIAVDKKEKKAMMKKAKGHNMLYRECFDSYYPQILDFIASKVK